MTYAETEQKLEKLVSSRKTKTTTTELMDAIAEAKQYGILVDGEYLRNLALRKNEFDNLQRQQAHLRAVARNCESYLTHSVAIRKAQQIEKSLLSMRQNKAVPFRRYKADSVRVYRLLQDIHNRATLGLSIKPMPQPYKERKYWRIRNIQRQTDTSYNDYIDAIHSERTAQRSISEFPFELWLDNQYRKHSTHTDIEAHKRTMIQINERM